MAAAVSGLKVRPISRLLKALADETRLRIVALLAHGELCVCHIEQALGLTQSNASRHLGILRNAGIVETRRSQNWVYYRLAEPEDTDSAAQLRALITSFTGKPGLREEVDRLLGATGPGACN